MPGEDFPNRNVRRMLDDFCRLRGYAERMVAEYESRGASCEAMDALRQHLQSTGMRVAKRHLARYLLEDVAVAYDMADELAAAT